jgi:hypothetical protein
MNDLNKLRQNIHVTELETLKRVLEETTKNPTPQMIEATAKLVEAVKLDGVNY